MPSIFQNPILSGFYPDPSVCRVEDDYYLVTSTFAYFPGVPVFHSKDLVNWRQIGNILDRPSQLNLAGATHSGGIFAPTIRYHEGTFYMITTNVSHGGNFIVKSKNPAGPWSDPYFIKNADGIDPSLFFDGDGKAYCMGTRARSEGAKYYGDNEIWLQEINLEKMELVGDSYSLWNGALRDVVWPEGPHLYKYNDYYYLLIAEAGTAHEHAVTVARSKSIFGPYEGNRCNPILTHRHLGIHYPVVNVGHGDLVQTQNGEWWLVVLASRTYGGYYRNLGRETFLATVEWENGWPVVNPGKGMLLNEQTVPCLPPAPVPKWPSDEMFNSDRLSFRWIYLRNPDMSAYSLTERKGCLRLYLRPERITDLVSPTFVGIRQTDMNFDAETEFEFEPKADYETCGICLIQSNNYHYRLEYTQYNDKKCIHLLRCEGGTETLMAKEEFSSATIFLKICASEQDLFFWYGESDKQYRLIASNVNGRILSPDIAGGFVGTCIGMYASSNGTESGNFADFHRFSYRPADTDPLLI